MGASRKALWLFTGGASGLVFKANSKKERIANALEKADNRQADRSRSHISSKDALDCPGFDGGFRALT
jgi:hypothetical protein